MVVTDMVKTCNDFETQMREVFGINSFPNYPSTGNRQNDAIDFAGQFKKVSVLRNDVVYYTQNTSSAEVPSYLRQHS
jgi:hypothetical protein